jgi:hypothetical protein
MNFYYHRTVHLIFALQKKSILRANALCNNEETKGH